LAFANKLSVKQAKKTCASNERKGFGGKMCWPIAEIYQHFSEEIGVRHKEPVT